MVTRFRFQSADGTGRSRRNGKLSVSHEEVFQMVKSSSDTTVYGRTTWTLLYCSCTVPSCSISFAIYTMCTTVPMYCNMNLYQPILYTHCVYIVLAFPSVYNCTILSMCRTLCSRDATDASLVGSSTPAGATTGQLRLVCMGTNMNTDLCSLCCMLHIEYVCVCVFRSNCVCMFVYVFMRVCMGLRAHVHVCLCMCSCA